MPQLSGPSYLMSTEFRKLPKNHVVLDCGEYSAHDPNGNKSAPLSSKTVSAEILIQSYERHYGGALR